jgi:hypothetical protein
MSVHIGPCSCRLKFSQQQLWLLIGGRQCCVSRAIQLIASEKVNLDATSNLLDLTPTLASEVQLPSLKHERL